MPGKVGEVEQLFERGEIVLCYKPNSANVKILYDSKIWVVYTEQDEKGNKYFEYKIHFLGFNRKDDLRVSEDSILKDNEENRKLQRELTKKANLQSQQQIDVTCPNP